ncbi:MAG: beta-lactamase family protein [Ignavibacteriales bacterium]|nr:beta-lactamase family protein [Ignavibacteriales bacterium]
MKSLLFILFIFFNVFIYSNNNDMEKQIDSIVEEFQNGLTPGISVAVLKSGKVIYQKGYGYADLENKIKIEPKTNFRLASITKQFTSFSILLLENEGKLSLSDSLTKFFPDFPVYGNKIKIENILQHTSGLLDYEDFVNDDSIQVKDKDVLEILMKQDSTYFEPGKEHRYSNSGYAILALIVEKLSGKSFAAFLKERIFEPVKMNNSVAFEKGISEIPNRAYGYAKTDSGFVYSDQSLTSAVLGDGGIYSSAIDLLKWNEEVENPTLLPKEKFAKAFEKGKTTNGEEFDYGFGWRLDPYKNHYRPYHTGSTCGFSNIYMKLPEYDLTIIVLMNVRDYDAKGYAEKIADLFIK